LVVPSNPVPRSKSNWFFIFFVATISVSTTVLVTVNVFALEVPPAFATVTSTAPLSPTGTVVVIDVAVLFVLVAVVEPNFTVALSMLVPVIVTVVPTPPLVGFIDVMKGSTLKSGPSSLPAGFVTLIFPVVAPDGTVVVIFVAELMVNDAVVPLNLTAVAPVKPVPVISTEVPTAP
jgi:hypothetical protein